MLYFPIADDTRDLKILVKKEFLSLTKQKEN